MVLAIMMVVVLAKSMPLTCYWGRARSCAKTCPSCASHVGPFFWPKMVFFVMMMRKLPGLYVPTSRACCAAACCAASSWSRRTGLVFGFWGVSKALNSGGVPLL